MLKYVRPYRRSRDAPGAERDTIGACVPIMQAYYMYYYYNTYIVLL